MLSGPGLGAADTRIEGMQLPRALPIPVLKIIGMVFAAGWLCSSPGRWVLAQSCQELRLVRMPAPPCRTYGFHMSCLDLEGMSPLDAF